MTGMLLCLLCEFAGLGPGERFRAPANQAGQDLMAQHVRQPHPALSAPAPGDGPELVDVPLDGVR